MAISLRASQTERWVKCPASVYLSAKVEGLHLDLKYDESYANEGTRAHEFAELEARRMAGMLVDDYDKALQELQADKIYESEMLEHAATYVEVIREALADMQATQQEPTIMFEHFMTTTVNGVTLSGTTDCIIEGGDTLYIIDYKYGVGIPVSAVNNYQLRMYALLYMLSNERTFSRVETVIVQPRINNIASATYYADDMNQFIEEILTSMDDVVSATVKYNIGSHCRYCKAKPTCEAYHEFLTTNENIGLAPQMLSNDQLFELLDKADYLIKWLKSVQEFAKERAIEGIKIPGYKLVETIRRRTIPEDSRDAVSATLLMAGYRPDQVFETSLLPITKLEKVLTKKVFKELLGPFVTLSKGSITLVSETDKRPTVSPIKPGDEF